MSQVYVCVRECKCDQQGDSNKNNICMNCTHTLTHVDFPFYIPATTTTINAYIMRAAIHAWEWGRQRKRTKGQATKTDDESEQQQLRGLGCQGRC